MPVDIKLSQLLGEGCQDLLIPHIFGGTYICIEGPQFSSISESKLYKTLGGDIVGMTNLPEAYLAKEAAMAYGALGMVTDFDSWRGAGTPFQTILENMRHNTSVAKNLIVNVVKALSANPPSVNRENQGSILTSPSFWSNKHKEIAEILLK
jgi:5'-methylthioadenosine phosphorylase